MSKIKAVSLALIVVSMLGITACTKDNTNVTPTPTPSPSDTVNGIVAGNIESYLEQVKSDTYQVEFNYSLKNQTEKDKTFQFSDSCQYGYELKNSKNEVVEPVSVGCSQAITEFTLKPGEEKMMDIQFDNLVADKYTLEAWLKGSDERQYKQTMNFEITEEQAQHTVDGVYTGQIDNNSIEIKVDNEAQAYRLTDVSRENLRFLVENDNVTLTYSKNNDQQFILHRITSKDAAISGSTSTGQYIEFKDNKVKVKVDNKEEWFQLSESLINELNKVALNDTINISYIENSKKEFIATAIHKVEKNNDGTSVHSK